MGLGDLTLGVPSIQHFLSRVVIHHAVVAILLFELYVGFPLFSSFGVVSKVDGSGLAIVLVDSVNHSAGDKNISHCVHPFYGEENKNRITVLILTINSL